MEKITKVVNLYKESYDVYIGRAGKGQDGYFGNPYKIQKGMDRGATLNMYAGYFYNRLKTDMEFKQKVHSLKGMVLGCFCKPHPCHGDIIIDYLENKNNE